MFGYQKNMKIIHMKSLTNCITIEFIKSLKLHIVYTKKKTPGPSTDNLSMVQASQINRNQNA